MRATKGTCASFSTWAAAHLLPQPDAATNHEFLNHHYGLTPCFSSEDVWRGPCVSTDRDRRLRLLQALVRLRRWREHDGD